MCRYERKQVEAIFEGFILSVGVVIGKTDNTEMLIVALNRGDAMLLDKTMAPGHKNGFQAPRKQSHFLPLYTIILTASSSFFVVQTRL